MKNKKYLIINADDFGMSSDYNQAICHLMKQGIVSSTSLMANGLAYEEAIQDIHNYNLKNIEVHHDVVRRRYIFALCWWICFIST